MLTLLSRDIALLYLSNIGVPGYFEPTRFSGLVTREGAGTDAGAEYHALRFTTDWFGFTGQHRGDDRFVPVADLPAGTELIRTRSGAEPEVLGRYRNRRVGWEPDRRTGGAGPIGWRLAPGMSALAGCHRVRAVYGGAEYDADLGPDPGEVTLVPPAVDADAFAVPAGGCERLFLSRFNATWHGAGFEIVDSRSDALTLVYLGGDRDTALTLGLVEVADGAWRVNVGHDEVLGVVEQIVDLDFSGV